MRFGAEVVEGLLPVQFGAEVVEGLLPVQFGAEVVEDVGALLLTLDERRELLRRLPPPIHGDDLVLDLSGFGFRGSGLFRYYISIPLCHIHFSCTPPLLQDCYVTTFHVHLSVCVSA